MPAIAYCSSAEIGGLLASNNEPNGVRIAGDCNEVSSMSCSSTIPRVNVNLIEGQSDSALGLSRDHNSDTHSNTPNSVAASTPTEDLPPAVCTYYVNSLNGVGQGCLRVNCKFFHGTEEMLEELRRTRARNQSSSSTVLLNKKQRVRPTGQDNTKRLVVCLNYLSETCDREGCRFLHLPPEVRPLPMSTCEYFAKGNCTRDKCRFFHGTSECLRELHAKGVTMYNPMSCEPYDPKTSIEELMKRFAPKQSRNKGDRVDLRLASGAGALHKHSEGPHNGHMNPQQQQQQQHVAFDGHTNSYNNLAYTSLAFAPHQEINLMSATLTPPPPVTGNSSLISGGGYTSAPPFIGTVTNPLPAQHQLPPPPFGFQHRQQHQQLQLALGQTPHAVGINSSASFMYQPRQNMQFGEDRVTMRPTPSTNSQPYSSPLPPPLPSHYVSSLPAEQAPLLHAPHYAQAQAVPPYSALQPSTSTVVVMSAEQFMAMQQQNQSRQLFPQQNFLSQQQPQQHQQQQQFPFLLPPSSLGLSFPLAMPQQSRQGNSSPAVEGYRQQHHAFYHSGTQ